MEGPYAPPPSLPRLRLSRQPFASVADDHEQERTPAGASQHRDHNVVDLTGDTTGDEDRQPTPKVNPNSNLPSSSDAAERLRALMARMPNPSNKTSRPGSPSERESDFEPPQSSPAHPSMVQRSIKDIFTRAYANDTPVKRTRRGSTSEVEDSPRVETSAKLKGKRKSLSDEEPENLSKASQASGSLFRSQAATFDILREKLNSQSQLKNQDAPFDNSTAENTINHSSFLRGLNTSSSSTPIVTSTPPHSMEISANSKFQTNLMDQDSEMQQMMNSDSHEGDSGTSRPVSFPSSHKRPARPGSSNSQFGTPSHRFSYHETPHVSRSRTSSFADHEVPEHLHDLEREWNKPHPKGHAEKSQSHSHSNPRGLSPSVTLNGHQRTRTQSGGSIHSRESGTSSRETSVNSHSDHKERMLDLEKDRNVDKEHGWNRPRGARSTSALSANSHASIHPPIERTRTLSRPSRPGSSLSTHSPMGLRRHSSASSHSDQEEEEEINHERERNWNAPKPHWGQHPHRHHSHDHARSPSPSQGSPSTSTSSVRSVERVRAQSLRTRGSPKGEPPVHNVPHSPTASLSKAAPRGTPVQNGHHSPVASSSKAIPRETPASQQTRPKSLLSTTRPRPVSYPARPHSPLPPINGKSQPTLSATQKSSTSQHRSPERDRAHSRIPSSPSPTPGKRPTANPNRNSMSHIPIRSRPPAKTPEKTSSFSGGHSRISEAQSQDAISPLPVSGNPDLDFDEGEHRHRETEEHSQSDDGTPRDVTKALPVENSRQHSPSPPPSQSVTRTEDEQFQKALSVAPPPSPPSPPTPPPVKAPASELEVISSTPTLASSSQLSTPPRRPTLYTSKLEFQTPPPPDNLPSLPSPSGAFEDEDTETERPLLTPLRLDNPSNTTLKTPRPPGAWSSTPDPVVQPYSPPPLEHGDSDSQYEGGLATPVPSWSRGSSLPMTTPKPPGGWVATPTPRKTIYNVRFEENSSQLELSAAEESTNDVSTAEDSANGHVEEPSGVSETGLATPTEEEEISLRAHTPEPAPSVSPSRSPRRSPKMNYVDEYGRRDSPKHKSPKNRNKNAVRVVDAMGNDIEHIVKEEPVKEEPCEDIPRDREDAVRYIHKGVLDLAHDLEEMDLSSDGSQLDKKYIRKLDDTSRSSREARNDLYNRLLASMQHGKMVAEADSRPNPSRIWFWTSIIICQAFCLFLLYRYLAKSTRELFLTTYYDPFYPDLHLYGVKYDYITFPRTPPSITSLANAWRQEGFTAFLDMAKLFVADWPAHTWRRWGADDMQSVRWPPT